MNFKKDLMKVTSASVLALGLFAANAQAGDLFVPMAPAAKDWSGFYAGGYAGASYANAEDINTGDFSHGESGFSGGLQAGFNFQTEQFVWGVEVDAGTAGLQWGELKTGHSYDLEAMGSLRLRLGMPVNNNLVYVTAGGGLLAGTAYSSESQWVSDSYFRPVVGVGVESMVTESISVKAEGLAYIGDKKFVYDDTPASEYGKIHTVWSARLGLNFHF